MKLINKHKKGLLLLAGLIIVALVVSVIYNGDASLIPTTLND